MNDRNTKNRYPAAARRWRVAAREMKGTFRRLVRVTAEERIRRYIEGGRIPWADGYSLCRTRSIIETLKDEGLMEIFREGKDLPERFGHGFDERCVEYPWVLSRLGSDPCRILDAGSALNFGYLLELSVWRNKHLHVLTLAPEVNCFWRHGISYLYDDLRQLPMRDALYDQVISISTLEHIGFDNREFAPEETHNQDQPDDFKQAVSELSRVLKPGGVALLTVPYGVAEAFGGHQTFDAEGIGTLIKAFGPAAVNATYFRYDEQGWQIADAEACKDRHFVDWISRSPEDREAGGFPVQDDNAAAGRSVVCLELTKSA